MIEIWLPKVFSTLHRIIRKIQRIRRYFNGMKNCSRSMTMKKEKKKKTVDVQ